MPLTFVNSSDYDKVQPLDKVDLKGVTVRKSFPPFDLPAWRPLLHPTSWAARPQTAGRLGCGWGRVRAWRHQSEAHGTQELAEGSTLTLVAKHQDGSSDDIPLTHTFNAPQIAWFKAGSALNVSPYTASAGTQQYSPYDFKHGIAHRWWQVRSAPAVQIVSTRLLLPRRP